METVPEKARTTSQEFQKPQTPTALQESTAMHLQFVQQYAPHFSSLYLPGF